MNNGFGITVLFQDGTSRIYCLPSDSTVSDLVHMIQMDSEVKIPNDKVINILYLGRFLDLSTYFHSVERNPQFTVNCFFRPMKKENPKEEENSQQQPLESDLRGFDRLTRMNFSQSQIHDFRQTFHLFHSSANLPEEARIELEEEWFPALFNGNEPPQFFLPRTTQSNDENLSINNNTDFSNEPDTETLLVQSPSVNAAVDSSPSWAPFFIGILCGYLFGLNWFIFIPLMCPDKSIIVGYFFGCGLYYMFQQIFK